MLLEWTRAYTCTELSGTEVKLNRVKQDRKTFGLLISNLFRILFLTTVFDFLLKQEMLIKFVAVGMVSFPSVVLYSFRFCSIWAFV